MITEVSFTIEAHSREDYRRFLTELFLNEKPGREGESSQYIYFVEEDSDGHRIYLKRPTNLNKGFDFEVRVENVMFLHVSKTPNVSRANSFPNPKLSKSNRPSHNNIIEDLILKKKENPSLFNELRQYLEKIYSCKEVSSLDLVIYDFQSGYPVDLIFKCIKWLFIEQDITYWNWSGRDMFYKSLSAIWEQ